MNIKTKEKNNFSVGLGLFDYINPILYTITSIAILKNINFDNISFTFYFIGAILSLIFGFSIPTVKLLVGLGKTKFKMPVNLVFYVNSGIFISGLFLMKTIFNLNTLWFILIIILLLILLLLLYYKTKKFNTIAVLIGSFGYIFIYISLILLSIKNNIFISNILYDIAVILFIFLCMVGIKANLKDSRVHWVIEISNVLCQLSVAIGTLLLFR